MADAGIETQTRTHLAVIPQGGSPRAPELALGTLTEEHASSSANAEIVKLTAATSAMIPIARLTIDSPTLVFGECNISNRRSPPQLSKVCTEFLECTIALNKIAFHYPADVTGKEHSILVLDYYPASGRKSTILTCVYIMNCDEAACLSKIKRLASL